MDERWVCTTCKRQRVQGDALPPLRRMLSDTFMAGKCKKCRADRMFKRQELEVWDPEEGKARKEAGIAKVESSTSNGVDEAWKQRAREAAMWLITTRKEFTADDVAQRVGMPIHRNAFGALFNGLAKKGLIKRVGYKQGGRAAQNARMISVWVAK